MEEDEGYDDYIEYLIMNEKASDLERVLQEINDYSEIAKNPKYLIIAIMNSGEEIIDLLLENGSNVNKLFSNTSAMHLAARWGGSNVLRQLVSHGGDVNLRDGENRTPIWDAVDIHNIQSVKFLIHNGADISVVDHEGYSVFDYCFKTDNYIINEIVDKFDLDFSEYIRKDIRENAIKWFEENKVKYVSS